jgi:NAD-dependent dihydropyrimidine dehydrogenase PreA subunit
MKHRYLENVTTLAYDAEKCIGCGMCEMVCPHGVFYIDHSKASIADKNSCMECGACAKNCPAEAIAVNAGVGCAAAIIYSWFTGKEPTCGCSGDDESIENKKCC